MSTVPRRWYEDATVAQQRESLRSEATLLSTPRHLSGSSTAVLYPHQIDTQSCKPTAAGLIPASKEAVYSPPRRRDDMKSPVVWCKATWTLGTAHHMVLHWGQD